jgi:hypothetical protein
MPVVFIDTPGSDYWNDWNKYVIKQLLKKGKISPEDMSLFKITDSAEEAVKEIARFYRNYHSLRYVKDQLVMRLQKPLTGRAVRRINREFADISAGEPMVASAALPEEKEFMELPRLVFPFNRVAFGRLRQLIDVLNGL